MSSKGTATLAIAVGLVCLFAAIICRFIITFKASAAGVPRSFWLEKVDFPGRGVCVTILTLGLILGMAGMVMGFVYTGKAKREAAAAKSGSTDSPSK